MVHVTFNDKVECHQYTASPMEDTQATNTNGEAKSTEVLASATLEGQTRFNYDPAFLKTFRKSPLAQVCPDFVKTGIRNGKGWTGKGQPPNGKGTVFSRPINYNYGQRRPLVPFFNNNQVYYGGNNRDDIMQPIQPIGHSRYNNQARNYFSRNPMSHNFQNRNLLPEFTKNMHEEDAEPEWYREGPKSPNDFIELHGFDGPGSQENLDSQTKHGHFGCNDGNTSGGANSGASSNNSSPPAKSTPAKATPTIMRNDAQRNRRPVSGRSNNWQNNLDNRHYGGAPYMNEFFKNFSAAQNRSNVKELTPIVRVEDVESSLLLEKMKFTQMINQMNTQQHLYKNLMYQQQEPIPTASQIMAEIEKILRTTPDPIYKRQEVRMLIKNIVEAVIPPINLMNLLGNPMTEPQNRETIVAALKLITQAQNNASNTIKIHKPTESELRAHMDAILQDAIIKKKMENLTNELWKFPNQHAGRTFPHQTQSFHQLFPQNSTVRPQNFSQSDLRGQSQPVDSVAAVTGDNYLNRWFSPALLNKALIGELPKIPSDPLRSEELESSIKQKLKVHDKNFK